MTSLLLGLSRRPLSGEDTKRAARLAPGQQSRARQALALLTEHSLAERVTLEVGPLAVGTELLVAPPAHPAYGARGGILADLLKTWRSLYATADASHFMRRQGLLLPAESLVAELGRLKRKRALGADDFSALGPRGAYLFPLVEESPFRENSLFTPEGVGRAFAKTAPAYAARTRGPLVGYALGLLGADGLDEETKAPYRSALGKIVGACDWPPLAKAAAGALLRHDALGATVAPTVLARALPTSGEAPPLDGAVYCRLLGAAARLDANFGAGAPGGGDLDYARALRRASELLATRVPGDETEPAPDELPAIAGACLLTEASRTAARVFDACLASDNQLLRSHPAFSTLLDVMDGGDFARSVERYADSAKAGWGDGRIAEWLAVTPHRLGPDASERLAVDALYAYGGGRTPLAMRYPLALDGSVAEVLHAFEQRGQGAVTARGLMWVLALREGLGG